jgi:hypothetical protein
LLPRWYSSGCFSFSILSFVTLVFEVHWQATNIYKSKEEYIGIAFVALIK